MSHRNATGVGQRKTVLLCFRLSHPFDYQYQNFCRIKMLDSKPYNTTEKCLVCISYPTDVKKGGVVTLETGTLV